MENVTPEEVVLCLPDQKPYSVFELYVSTEDIVFEIKHGSNIIIYGTVQGTLLPRFTVTTGRLTMSKPRSVRVASYPGIVPLCVLTGSDSLTVNVEQGCQASGFS